MPNSPKTKTLEIFKTLEFIILTFYGNSLNLQLQDNQNFIEEPSKIKKMSAENPNQQFSSRDYPKETKVKSVNFLTNYRIVFRNFSNI